MKKLLIIMAASLFCCTVNKDKYPTDMIQTRSGEKLKVMFFAHSSLAFEFENQWIYTDPVKSHADYASLPKADFILVTHEHFDHLDAEAISQISKPDTRIILSRSAAEQLGRGEAMDNGDVLSLGNFTVEAVPAYNTTPDRQGFHPPGGRDNGYVLNMGGSRIYLAGDTEDTPEMKALKDIDVAFLPVNQPFTMTEEQAAGVIKTLKPKIFYPYHYGQVDHETDVEKLKELLNGEATEVRIRPME